MPRLASQRYDQLQRGQKDSVSASAASRPLATLMQQAGNEAVQRLLEGGVAPELQRQIQLDPRLFPPAALGQSEADGPTLDQVRPAIVAWLEPQRAELENRARNTSMGLASPAQALTMPGLVAMVQEAVPSAQSMSTKAIASVVRDWIHVSIPDRMTGGQLSDAELVGAIQSVLGKPGTVRVERKGSAWMEITAGGIEIGRDDSAPVDATMTVGWDGSVGASVSLANVKGAFQIAPDRTWQLSLALPASSTPAVLNQLAGVFGVADRAARSVAGRVDALGGHLGGLTPEVAASSLSPIKDAIDTLSSTTDKENKVSFGVTASGDFGGCLAVQATLTIRW